MPPPSRLAQRDLKQQREEHLPLCDKLKHKIRFQLLFVCAHITSRNKAESTSSWLLDHRGLNQWASTSGASTSGTNATLTIQKLRQKLNLNSNCGKTCRCIYIFETRRSLHRTSRPARIKPTDGTGGTGATAIATKIQNLNTRNPHTNHGNEVHSN
jgi:hypothetical protein